MQDIVSKGEKSRLLKASDLNFFFTIIAYFRDKLNKKILVRTI